MKTLNSRTKILGAAVPYIAVLFGMYVFESAWAAIGLYHAGILAFFIYHRPAGLLLRLRRGYYLPMLIPGLLLCALAAPVMYFLWPMICRPDATIAQWLAAYGLEGTALILLIPYFSVIHPVLEEAHWRTLTERKDYKIICPQDAAFAGYHMIVLSGLMKPLWLLLVFGVLISASSFWRWAAGRFDGYGLPVLTHAVADASVLAGALWLMSVL